MIDAVVRRTYSRWHGLFRLWYNLWMFLGSRSRKRKALQHHASVLDTSNAMRSGRAWVSDPLRGLFDYPSHPEVVQARIDAEKPIGDCDDHACYHAVQRLHAGCVDVRVAFLYYYDDNGKRCGHAICVWYEGGQWYWADYGAANAWAGPRSAAPGRLIASCWLRAELDGRGGLYFFDSGTW